MGREVKQIKGYKPDQIKALFNIDDKYKTGLRLYAVYLVSIGKSSRKLEDLYNISFKQILNWVHRFEEMGIEGLKDKKGRGRKPKLSKEQVQALTDLLKTHSPIEYGYNTEKWTGPLLIDWIKKNFDIDFKKAQIYNVVKQFNYTFQKVKELYPETDKNK
jgi:transposase